MYATSSALKCQLMHVKNEPAALRGPARLQVLDAVLHENRDVVAVAQPGVVEQLRELVRPIVQLAVRARLPESHIT